MSPRSGVMPASRCALSGELPESVAPNDPGHALTGVASGRLSLKPAFPMAGEAGYVD